MNRQTILSSILGIALLSLAACSNNETGEEINVCKAIEFKVDFADYNAEQDVNVTRAGNKDMKFEQQTVNFGNGVIALCTLQPDTTLQPKPATRALPNDTYTMLAYDPVTRALKGELTGTVSGNKFTPVGKQQNISLAPGEYEFVLFNSKVVRSGDQLAVARDNANTALIGRTTQTIKSTPQEQKVSFTLKHVGSKVRMKLTGLRAITNAKATLSSVGQSVPATLIYHASSGAQSTGSSAAMSAGINFGPSSDTGAGTHIALGTQETFFLPGTNVSDLKLTFTGGTIYRQNMANASLILNPAPSMTLEQNGAYVLNVKLMYNFLYLMSDGNPGLFSQTTYGGGTKTPIGVVVSRSNKLAISLYDAPSKYAYSFGWSGSVQFNTTMSNNFSDHLNDMHGYEYTWTTAYSTSACNSYIRGSSKEYGDPNFPAFYAAGQYTPRPGSLKWHLPSMGEWVYVYTALGLGNSSALTDWGASSWDGDFAFLAFDQVNAQRFDKKVYWTSSEADSWCGVCVNVVSDTQIGWSNAVGKGGGNLWVRPFIKY